ncbi:lysophospholipid acyltransferase family protein [Aestuariimicrobium sp. Y1814]|uniref:lysophospholipid acyltransferase family protein n=1 Tax=Aestuariimicrobium sp. Y1814 TaxID=3418742 RepID=UPI003DA7165F
MTSPPPVPAGPDPGLPQPPAPNPDAPNQDTLAAVASAAGRVRDLAVSASRRAADQAGDLARRAAAPGRALLTALRGQGTTAGLRHLPQEGPVILAVNHRHVLDARALAAALPRPVHVVATADLEVATRARRAGHEPRRRDAWQQALDALAEGEVVAVFPEGAPSPDSDLHKGRDAVGRLVLAAGVTVVPAVLDTRAASLVFGPALDFSRFRGLPVERTLARGVTDETMAAIADLGGLRYRDTYPTTARDQLRSGTQKRRDQLRARAEQRRMTERRAIEARQLADLEERRDLARLHREAEEQARTRAEQAAERDRQRRVVPPPDNPVPDSPVPDRPLHDHTEQADS